MIKKNRKGHKEGAKIAKKAMEEETLRSLRDPLRSLR
jgi:hypothetical protein